MQEIQRLHGSYEPATMWLYAVKAEGEKHQLYGCLVLVSRPLMSNQLAGRWGVFERTYEIEGLSE